MRGGNVDGGLRNRNARLGPADELRGLKRRVGQHQRHRVGQAHVLRGVNHNAPRDETRVFPGVNHPGQPVERRVGVASAHGFDERGDGVVVRVAVAVIHYRLFLDARFGHPQRDANRAVRIGRCGERGDFEGVERLARVAVGEPGEVRAASFWISSFR